MAASSPISYPSVDSVEGSASRNLPHLIEALRPLIGSSQAKAGPDGVRILEIASGFGEHLAGYAREWPSVQFQGTERDREHVRKINDSISSDTALVNVLPAKELDVLEPEGWDNIRALRLFDGVIAFNILHCSPPALSEALFQQAAKTLKPCGWVAVYGAFLQDDGSFASEGDKKFNERFKGIHEDFGLRRIVDVEETARRHGFELEERKAMPAGNWFLVFRLL